MKKVVLATLFMVSVCLHAETLSTTMTLPSTSASDSTAQASNAGNSQSITFTSPGSVKTTVEGTQTLKNVPSVSGPALTTSNDTCMGSSSGGFNAPGVGVSIGSTWVDGNCKMLKNSRELWNMGMKAAAMALMCTDPANREALEVTGYKCPAKKQEQP